MKKDFGFSFFNEIIIIPGVITWMCYTTRDGELEGEYQGRFLGAINLQETGGKIQCLSRIDITRNLLKAQDALRFLAHFPSLFFNFVRDSVFLSLKVIQNSFTTKSSDMLHFVQNSLFAVKEFWMTLRERKFAKIFSSNFLNINLFKKNRASYNNFKLVFGIFV